MKDVVLNLTGVTEQLPFRKYYEQRNGKIAELIAKYLDKKYLGEVQIVRDENYIVPPKTITNETAGQYGIKEPKDFYGGSIDKLDQVGKAVLHPLIKDPTGKIPSFYSPGFATCVDDDRIVLPGFTVFSVDDAKTAFYKLNIMGYTTVRVKNTMQSDGHEQANIKSIYKLLEFLANHSSTEKLNIQGLVLEAAVEEPRTVSVGYAVLGQDIYSFVANQKNDKGEDGRDRYMGAKVKVMRGPMQAFNRSVLDGDEVKSLVASIGFFKLYSYFNPILSRISFDAINGKVKKGEEVCGITDITARLGGTCPALILSALELKNHPELKIIESEVTLNYDPKEERPPEETGGTDFINLPSLRITARINKTHE